MKEILKNILSKRTSILWLSAIIFIIISFFEFSSSDSMDREVSRLENRVHKRQQQLEDFVNRALETPDSVFLDFPDFPDDMVLYKYVNESLHSWVNQLPISNDDIDLYRFGYQINYLNSRGVANTPLAYITSTEEQYASLGSAWYIVKRYTKGNTTILAALLIQTDYHSDNAVLKNEVNKYFSLNKQLSIVPVTYDESYVIKGKDGAILFSVLKNTPSNLGQAGLILRWLAIFLVIAALFSELQQERRVKLFAFTAGILLILRFCADYLASMLNTELDLFSPSLYADFGYFDSLAELFIDNSFIFLLVLALFMIRKSLALIYYKAGIKKMRLLKVIFSLTPVIIIAYIHITLRSLILNSSIVLELFRIDEIIVYSILVYLSYGMLFLALLFSLQLMRPVFNLKKGFSFLKIKPILIFIFLVSLYTLVVVSIYGFKKEMNRNRVLTTKMAVERDLNVEIQLRTLEVYIQNDPVVRMFAEIDNINSIASQLTETYLWRILQRYDLRVTICKNNDSLALDSYSPLVHCNKFFMNEIGNYAIPLSSNNRFFFMNNYNGRISYLGVFSYPSFRGDITLYLEFDSKFIKEAIGYPDILLNHKQIDNYSIPPNYSYAKYLNNRLVSYRGNYNYPYSIGDEVKQGYNLEVKDSYLHFKNKSSSESLIIISRPERSIFPYFVSFSYIVLFYSLLILGLIRIRHKGFFYKLPKNSFRRKITFLIIASLVFALISMGAGSIWFSINYFDQTNRTQMEEKLQSVQSSLSEHSKTASSYNDPLFYNTKLFMTMSSLSNNAQIDMNIYSPNGLMIRTTQLEMFDNYLVGYRMNPKAYREIIYNRKKQFINREHIGELTYYSLYAPLFNIDGKLIAIVNVPYFSRDTDIKGEASNVIATIINIYLLLLLAAVFGGIALSNSLSKPLAEISKKMQLLDFTQNAEHIDYDNRDELGILVAAYNKMVDDLEASTKQLAQSEREQAWREMARQIAHEIKNPLTPMRLSIQHLVRLKGQNIPDWPQRFDALASSLIEQIDILSDAASEFSSFSRFYSEDLSKVDINNLIREQIILFNTSDDVEINFESDMKDAILVARKTQLTRVCVNLLSNAMQAIESQPSGRINVSLLKQDQYYAISFEDDGQGVPENLTHRLFKPNFTTKSGGTGLGLAICRSIIEQSQGTISYRKSDKLGGACFTIRLPLSSE